MTDKIYIKKIVVGTPIKRVTSGAFNIENLSGVDVSATESDGSILAYKSSTSKFVTTNLRGSGNISATYDSSNNQYVFGFDQNTFSGNLIPSTNETQDLGSTTNKWRDLFLSGNTIQLGSVLLRDSGGSFVVVDSSGNKETLGVSLSSNNTAVFSFDSGSGQFTFNDSDLARTNINETFHSGITVLNGATIDSATITNLANTNLTGSQATFDSANIGSLRVTGNTVLDGNLTITGTETILNTETIQLADNTIVLNSNATGTPSEDAGIEIERGSSANKSFLWDEGSEYWTLGSETLQTTGKILYSNVYSSEGDLPSASTYHGMFAHVHGTGKGYFAHGGAWHKLLDETSSTTASLTEGSNLYYTRARFDSALGDATSTASVRGYVSGDKGLVYNSSTGVFDIDSANIKGMFSATGDLTYNSSTGAFSFDVEDVYTKVNFDSDLGDALVGGTGISYDSSSDTISITNTGVAAATYGSATQIPVFTVNAQGQLDSAGSVAVAGVTSFTFDSSDGDISIGTADGATFTTRINLSPFTTSTLTEQGNLYYTDVRARNSQSVTDAGGDGSLSYNTSTGVLTYTGPSASETRAHFSAGGDMTYDSSTGRFSIDVEQIYTKANFDSDFLSRLVTQIDSAGITTATIGTLNNTTLVGSQATFDSATITTLTNTNMVGSQATFDSANITALGGITGFDATSTSTLRGLFSAGGDLTYNSSTGQYSFDVETVYTKANFDSDLGDANTAQLPEGTNLYYTTARSDSDFDIRLATKTTANVTEGSNLYYTTVRSDSDFDIRLATKSTTNVSEGNNLYYTTARADSDAKASLLVNDAGGDGSLAYDSATGVFTYTGPSSSDVRAHFSAGGDMTYDSATGRFSIDVEQVYTKANFDSDLRQQIAGGTGITIQRLAKEVFSISNTGVAAATYGSATSVPQFSVNAQGQIDSARNVTIAGVTGVDFDSSNATITIQTTGGNFTDVISLDPFTTANLSENTNLYYTDARARASISAGGNLSYNNSTGVMSYTTPTMYADADARSAISVTDAGGDGSLAYNSTTGVITYTGPSASEVRAHLTANKGLSVSNGVFDIDSANVKAMLSGSSGVNYSVSSGAITADTNEIRGFFTANKGLSVSSGEFNIDSANVRGMFSGGTGVTYTSGTGAIAIGQAVATSDDVTFQDVTVSGNLTITGDTVQTGSVVSDNNFTGLTNANTGNSQDFGFYGKYVEGGTTKYGGVFYDASTDNTFRLFTDTQTLPTSTVNTGATGYSSANLIVKDITAEDLVLSGNLTVNGATVTNSATNTTIEDALIELGSGNTGSNANDLGLVLERGTTGDNVFMGWDESIDRVRFATTTATGASTGDLTLTNANVQAGRFYGDLTGDVTGTVSDISNFTTANLTENTNLYHTTARARGAISVTDAGGDGSASYNSSTGVITYTGPSATQVRAHLTANKGLSVSSGEFNIDSANVKAMFSAGGDLSYSNGVFSYTDSDRTAAQIKGLFSGGTGITYSNGAISTTDGDIVHDNLSGFVANEHIDHSSVSVIAGTGLAGGGTIAANRTINVVGGKGITANANDIQIDSANVLGMFSAGGDLSYNSGTGAFSFSETYSSAAELLTALKTVDTNSSGLNADTLDGQQGSYYTNASNLSSGTIPNDRIDVPASGDWWSGSPPKVGNDGVMEVGKYIDFHITDSGSADFDTRLVSGTNSLTIGNAGRILTTGDEGSGNGLDADTLDGQEGTHYRINVYNNAGTLLN